MRLRVTENKGEVFLLPFSPSYWTLHFSYLQKSENITVFTETVINLKLRALLPMKFCCPNRPNQCLCGLSMTSLSVAPRAGQRSRLPIRFFWRVIVIIHSEYFKSTTSITGRSDIRLGLYNICTREGTSDKTNPSVPNGILSYWT